jgi:hypothetical protein
LVLDVEAEVRAVPVEFGADNGFDAGFGGGLGEFDSAMQVVFISQSNRRELVSFGQGNNGFGRKGGIEERVVTVEIERDGDAWRFMAEV